MKERLIRDVGYGFSLEGVSAADLVKSMQTAAMWVITLLQFRRENSPED